MTKKAEKPEARGEQNEGEGSRTAARRYNQGVVETVDSGTVAQKAREAAEALDGVEGEELRRAEEEGKSHAADVAPKGEPAGAPKAEDDDDKDDETSEDWLRKVG